MKLLRLTKCVSYSCLFCGAAALVHLIPVVAPSRSPHSSTPLWHYFAICLFHTLSLPFPPEHPDSMCLPPSVIGGQFFVLPLPVPLPLTALPLLATPRVLRPSVLWAADGNLSGNGPGRTAVSCIWLWCLDRPIKSTKATEYCHELAAWCFLIPPTRISGLNQWICY